MTATVAMGLAVGSGAAYARPTPRPAAEVVVAPAKLDLPTLPTFDLPRGPLTIKRLWVAGEPHLGTRITVHGYVTYAYDCAADIRKLGESVASVRKRVDSDPTRCERPKFHIGDARATRPDNSLWVVDVPRPYNKLELASLSKPERTLPLRCEPGERDPNKQICPPYRAGDEVIVTGTFALESAHSERDSDGLLVYESMRNITQGWQTSGATFELTTATDSTQNHRAPASLPELAKPALPPVDQDARRRSFEYLYTANRALQNNDFVRSRAAYGLAINEWAGSHLAWYGLGLTSIKLGSWRDAVDAFDHATALLPDEPMYQMFDGVAHYELAVEHEREAEAQKTGRTAAEIIDPELSHVRFDDADLHLRYAIQSEPHLWRAHYYLGRIARNAQQSAEAAREFAESMRNNPVEPAPCIALTELLLRWDYYDEAIATARQGAPHVRPSDSTLVFFALGQAYESKRDHTAAIEAFGKALEIKPDNHRARYERGRAYFQVGDRSHAKLDLEEFVKSDSPLSFARAEAKHMLDEIAAKHGHGP
jgi:tetratricopeptide (TPR) repeat protein